METITGSCLQMCPQTEAKMRTRENLLNRLEVGPQFQPVKEYTRSAAGKADEPPSCIRPPHVLEATVTYLFNNVVDTKIGNEIDVFKFVSNRLQSVKQDLFKQQCPASIALPILEPIARYFAWASYWFCEEKFFESYLHDHLLLEVIKEILRLSEQDNFPASDDIESLYILYTLGESNGLLRAMKFQATRRSSIIHKCQILSLHWFHRQYTPVCKKIKNLPPLLAAFVSVKHLETIKKYALRVMSISHHSSRPTQLDALLETQLFINKTDILLACKFYSITCTHNGVLFQRSTKFIDDQNPFEKQPWIQKKLGKVCLLSLCYNDEAVLKE